MGAVGSRPRPARGARQAPIRSAQVGLRLLALEINREVLGALAARGPMIRSDLRTWLIVGSSAVNSCLERLLEAGLVKVRAERVREFALTTAGRELAALADLLTAWLASHPNRDLRSGSIGCRALGAAADGWEAALIEWIACRSPREDEFGQGFQRLSRQRVGAQIASLEAAGVVELRMTRDGSRRCRLTGWGRGFLGLVAAIARWERSHLREGSRPSEPRDVIVSLAAALPLVRLPGALRGYLTLTVEAEHGEGGSQRAEALWARAGRGRVQSWGPGAAPGNPLAWASGPVGAWLDALVDGRSKSLRGDDTVDGRALSEALTGELHAALLGYQKR